MADATPMRIRRALAAGALVCALSPLSAGADVAGQRRLAPPQEVGCARDHLTVYVGRVTSYRRAMGQTTLGIRTDSGTTERVTLRHPGSDDPSPRFQVDRAPFTPADWARIETAPGALKSPMRVAAWVCSDGGLPLIDWQPPR